MDALEELSGDPRVRIRREGAPDPDGRCVVYWMQRAQRTLDNPALDAAVEAANRLRLPAVVFFAPVPFYPGGNLRHYTFLAQGVADIARGAEARGLAFAFRPYPSHSLVRFCDQVKAALVVGDENPLREPERWRRVAAERLRVPLWTVDADVIVPVRLLEKEQYAARTIRPRIHRLLDRFMAPPANPAAEVPWQGEAALSTRDWREDWLDDLPLDLSAGPVDTFEGGTSAGLRLLERFVREGLPGYAGRRNHPEVRGTSRLSPYLHFGHLGPHTVAWAVKDAGAPEEDTSAFLEEMIVRRELAVNFAAFNSRYDRLDGCERWALATLESRRTDARVHLYSEDELEAGRTHDRLWNAAQTQMVKTGWTHGYLRMYWAKKILEWSPSPEEAFERAVRLNDRWEMDGRDPNGYAGVAWAIGGKHDRPWGPSKPVIGTIRPMSEAGCRRKFDVEAYIRGVSDGSL